MEIINFNIDNSSEEKLLSKLIEKFNLFSNKDISYCLNKDSNSNYLNFTVTHVDTDTPYTKLTSISHEISLTVQGGFDCFLQWIIAITLPGLCQPTIPGVDITDMLPLLKSSNYSSQELFFKNKHYQQGQNRMGNSMVGAVLIFYKHFSSTSEYGDAITQQMGKFETETETETKHKDMLIVPFTPFGGHNTGELSEILKGMVPSIDKEPMQVLAFYK